ncbi:hypothetical protein BS47DRAFT_1394607 [Hydnum rufescens UP504]|uniref:Uncharacterized protein n=1 Tax=Hydnum rufescens UP504 TaxID=1448309 RepID=A0A9P6DVU8_9AGAM|nr:hypothetical protein BS47DRAFT_1394607 [Hydnum rufescens UP504]
MSLHVDGLIAPRSSLPELLDQYKSLIKEAKAFSQGNVGLCPPGARDYVINSILATQGDPEKLLLQANIWFNNIIIPTTNSGGRRARRLQVGSPPSLIHQSRLNLHQSLSLHLTEPFTWSSSGQLSNTVYRPLEEYPDLCTLTVASGEISADVVSNLSRPYFCHQPWSLMYTNSRRSFQYIDQLPNAWLETYPSFAFYEGSMNVNGPWSADALSQRYALRGPSQLSRPSDFTRFPQRWNKHLPYLPYVYRHPSDPNTPQPRDLDPITNRFYLKKHYVDALAAFVGSASTTAQRWYSHIRRNGFHVPVPLPSCEYPGANFRRHFEHHDTKARIMADVEIFLQHGYLCRGYAQWLMRKFVACLSRELGMPCPHFGVDDKLIGAVFRMEDLEDSRVSGVVRGLERDGVPVFAATILEPWSETVWDRIPCLKTPWRNTDQCLTRTRARLPSCISGVCSPL